MKIPRGKFGDVLLVDGGWSPISLAIKRRTLSDWSHIACIVDQDFVADMLRERPETRNHIVGQINPGDTVLVEALGSGVKVRASVVYSKSAWRVRTPVNSIGPIERAKGTKWLIGEVGAGYDWRGVLLGHILRNQWVNRSDGWFCSELCAAWQEQMDRQVIADTAASLVPPMLYASTSGLRTTDWHKRRPYGWPE